MDEKLLKAVGRKFPTMNTILALGEKGKGQTTVTREVKGHIVTLELGIGNAYIIDVQKIEE